MTSGPDGIPTQDELADELVRLRTKLRSVRDCL